MNSTPFLEWALNILLLYFDNFLVISSIGRIWDKEALEVLVGKDCVNLFSVCGGQQMQHRHGNTCLPPTLLHICHALGGSGSNHMLSAGKEVWS
eukprot:11886392-Ditylum_brightwellii.AAC.1